MRKVTDAITTIFSRGDFVNNPSYSGGYNYDAAGNVARDSTKGIISSDITYTYFNKPSFITFNPSGRLYYSYDAAGNKVQEYINFNGGPRMNYIGTALYKNDTLQSISMPVGRTDMSKSVPQEQYFVKDHLGNVRSVVSDAIGSGGIGTMAAQSKTYNATYETGNLSQEEQTFDQVAVLSEDKPESTSSSDSKAALLTTDNTSTPNVGTTLLLKVMAGDKLSLNADNYYESSESNSSSVSGSSFEQVVNSLAQAAGQLSGTEGTIASNWAAQMLNSSSLQQAYDALQNSATDPDKPRAYLNYLFFDEQMQLLPAYSRIWQADGAGNWSRIGTDANETMDVPQNGYVASYISTQSAEPTYFDNLAVTLQPGILLEEKHYYPYGLPIVGMGSTSAGMLPNKNRYQGNEYREDVGLNWMDFHNRRYDPQLGRFMGIDPMADAAGQQGLSPYHAMACNPSTMVDPLGLAPHGEAHGGGGIPQYGNEMAMRFPTMPNFMERYLNFGEMTSQRDMAVYQLEMIKKAEKDRIAATKGKSDARAMNAQFTFSILVANMYGDITDNTQTNNDGDQESKDGNIITYKLPISDELLKEYAKQAGKQSLLGTQCNVLALKFVALVLNAQNIDWGKVDESNRSVKEDYKDSYKLVDVAGFDFIRVGGRTPNVIGEYLNEGLPAYVIERQNGTYHRVVIVKIDYNIKNVSKSKVWVYDPNKGAIISRKGFFSPFSNYPGTFVGSPISNNSFIIFNKR